jgi:hypothetical protein
MAGIGHHQVQTLRARPLSMNPSKPTIVFIKESFPQMQGSLSLKIHIPTTMVFARDLGTQNVTNSWEVTANVNYNGTNFNDGTKYGQYVEVLDANSKVLARFYLNQPALTGNVSVVGNTQTIVSDTKANVQLVSNYFQPLDIKCVGGTITFKYGNYSAVSDGIFDVTGDWHHPKTFRIDEYHVSSSTNVPRIINFKNVLFSSN